MLLASSHSILFANQAALTIFGLTADRIQGILVSAILPELNRERLHSLNSLSKRPSLIDASVAAAPEPYLEQDVLLMARCGGPQSGKTFTVSASFGRLAKEGLIKGSQVDPSDLLVVTLKKTILKASGSGTMLLMSRYRSEFEEVKTIGKGGFGIVVQAKNRLDGQEYAIKKGMSFFVSSINLREHSVLYSSRAFLQKIIVRLSCSPENVNIFNNAPSVTPKESKFFKGHKRHISESDHRLINEVKTFAQLSNHPNVIRYFNAWIEPVELDDSPKKSSVDDSASESSDSEDDEDDDETAFSVHKHRSTLFIQMQLCPYQDLRKWIVNRGPGVKLEASLGIFWQIVSGLVHIHTQGVVHRDVKPENIFVHQENVFLGDFGLAKNIQDHILSSSPQLSKAPLNEHVMSTEEGICLMCATSENDPVLILTGTYFYMAPETLASQTCTTKADIYSLGIILFELLTHFETAMERVVVR